MKRNLATVAAAFGAVGTLAPFRLAGEATGYDVFVGWWVDWLTYVLLVSLLMAVAVGLTLAYALADRSHRWAVAAIVLYVLGAFLGGAAGLFAGYAAAVVLGVAMAAGDPLPPADPTDDRLYAPMPRRED